MCARFFSKGLRAVLAEYPSSSHALDEGRENLIVPKQRRLLIIVHESTPVVGGTTTVAEAEGARIALGGGHF